MTTSENSGVQQKDYKNTLQLPQTAFNMKADLPIREPLQVEKWMKDGIYQKMVERNRKKGAPKFLLHDGPPYANGNIHIGHALNKVLKDVVVKYKNLSGFETSFVPGWDCHGLPIELGVEKQLIDAKRDKHDLPITELRDLCRAYAQKYVDLQRTQFQRLEIFADWDKPYVTMAKDYVASIIRELGRCADQGVLYQGNKPVYWCCSCNTALAEAEIEYAEKESPSIYVKFDLPAATLKAFSELNACAKEISASRVSLVIWTTTPWTLPSNLGISLHPEFDYVAVEVPTLEGNEIWIIAQGLLETFSTAIGMAQAPKVLLTFKGEQLHRLNARHPFIDRDSLIMLGEHVTLEAGTGAVHTAPGHGADDYRVGRKYNLEAFAPVDGRGCYTDGYAEMKGQYVFKCNEPIIAKLQESGHLIQRKNITHSYPTCWRCAKPIIFRATPQWFISMDVREEHGVKRSLRDEARKAIHEVQWVPSWGINRILGMVDARPDWCVSRQRTWGVPITVFYCEDCETPKADAAVFNRVADLVNEKGPDVWYTESVENLLPPGSQCAHCGSKKFRKEKDILDVWFDSGVSHAAVCEARGLGWPADLYLEGSDQHRGWFQTSLIEGVASRGKAPFKTVLTHGFVNDAQGKKMSKSKGNVTSPIDLMKTHGAEILRMWVILEDYRNDVNFSKESLDRVTESYRKIRNTVRFILGSLFDFNPDTDLVSSDKMNELDRWALSRAAAAIEKIGQAYEQYEFHSIYQQVVNLCVVDLSAVYFDILKDRLYTDKKDSLDRRSSQSALYLIGSALIRAVAPILSFTAEEAWSHLNGGAQKAASIFLTDFPRGEWGLSTWLNPELEGRYELVWKLRTDVLKALEEARREKVIGHAREAKVVLTLDSASLQTLKKVSEDLRRVFLVSDLELKEGAVAVTVGVASGAKCARCWTYTTEVGTLSAPHDDLCKRCSQAVTA